MGSVMSLLTRVCSFASVAMLLLPGQTQASTIYLDGTSPTLSGVFDVGTHLANYIGPTQEEGNGTALDGTRVYIFDVNDHAGVLGPTAQANFNLLVWQFGSAKDSVRLYTHQDHYFGGPITDLFTASEVLEYSVWGCNGPTNGCKNQADWTLLSDPNSVNAASLATGKPTYTFNGADAAVIYRAGSAEFGITNAMVQDFTFGQSYNFFAIRGSTIAMQADTADPELDAMVAFDRHDVPLPVPEPSSLLLLVAGVCAVARRAAQRP